MHPLESVRFVCLISSIPKSWSISDELLLPPPDVLHRLVVVLDSPLDDELVGNVAVTASDPSVLVCAPNDEVETVRVSEAIGDASLKRSRRLVDAASVAGSAVLPASPLPVVGCEEVVIASVVIARVESPVTSVVASAATNVFHYCVEDTRGSAAIPTLTSS